MGGGCALSIVIEEVLERRQESTAGSVLDEQRLHFEARLIEQVVQRRILIYIFLVDFHSLANQGVCNFFVRHQYS